MYSVSNAVAIATVIYLCISCLCQDLTNTNLLLQSELWHFHTFNELDKEALSLHCKVDLKLDDKVYLHGL